MKRKKLKGRKRRGREMISEERREGRDGKEMEEKKREVKEKRRDKK